MPQERDISGFAKGTEAAIRARSERAVALEDAATKAVEHPNQFLRDMLKMQAKVVYDMQHKLVKVGRIEDRKFYTESVRECRLLATELRGILEAEGDMAEAEAWLTGVAAQLAQASDRLDEALRPSAEPSVA